MIFGDAPRCFSGEKIASISLFVNFEENALSFLIASLYNIPLSFASNATLCTSLYATNLGIPFLISASKTNSAKICPFVMYRLSTILF